MPWYEQVCMIIAVLGALFYQVLVGAWYFEWLSSETMLSCTTIVMIMTVLKMIVPSVRSSLLWILTGQLPYSYEPRPCTKPIKSKTKSKSKTGNAA